MLTAVVVLKHMLYYKNNEEYSKAKTIDIWRLSGIADKTEDRTYIQKIGQAFVGHKGCFIYTHYCSVKAAIDNM